MRMPGTAVNIEETRDSKTGVPHHPFLFLTPKTHDALVAHCWTPSHQKGILTFLFTPARFWYTKNMKAQSIVVFATALVSMR